MIFAVFDPSPLTVYINGSFFTFILYVRRDSAHFAIYVFKQQTIFAGFAMM